MYFPKASIPKEGNNAYYTKYVSKIFNYKNDVNNLSENLYKMLHNNNNNNNKTLDL